MAFDAGALIGRLGLNIDGWKASIATIKSDTTALQKKAGETGAAFEKFGKNIMPVSVAIAAVGGLSVKAAMDFNKLTGEIESLGVSNVRVIQLKKQIQELGAQVGKSTSDISGGVYQVVSAFGDSNDTMKLVAINARMATAGVASTADAFNLTAAVMKGYNDVSAESAQKASDLAFQTVKLGQTTLPELASSMGKTIPLASALNVKQEELFASMATLAGVTGSTAEVSTQLRAVMQALAKPTEAASVVIKDLGYSSAEAMVADLGLVGAMQKMIGTTDGTAQSVGKLFESVEAITAALALSGKQSGDFQTKLKGMHEAAGASDEAFKRMTTGTNKAGFEFSRLMVEVTTVAQKFGDALMPALTVVGKALGVTVKVVGGLLDAFNSLPGPIKAVGGGLVIAAAAAGPVALAVGKVVTIFSKLPLGLAAGIAKFGPWAAAGAAAIGLVKWGFDELRKSQEKQLATLVESINTFATANKSVQDFFNSNVKGAEEAKAALYAHKAELVAAGKAPQEAYKEAVIWLTQTNQTYKDHQATVTKAIQKKNEDEKAAERSKSAEVLSIMDRINDAVKKNSLDQVQYAKWKAEQTRIENLKELTNAGGSAEQIKEVWRAYHLEVSSIEKEAAIERDKIRQEEIQKASQEAQAKYAAALALQEQKYQLDIEWQEYMAEQSALLLEAQGMDLEADIFRLTAEKERHKATLMEKYGATAQYLLAEQALEQTYQEQKAAAEKAAAEKRKQAADKELAEEKARKKATLDFGIQTLGQAFNIFSQYYQARLNALTNEYNSRRQWIMDNVTDETEREKQLEALETEFHNKQYAMKKKAAIADKAGAMLSAVVNTAAAVAKALPNIPLAIIAGAMGAAQIALIASQPIPFAEGGVVMPSPGGTIAQVAEAGQPEAIIPLDRFDEFFGQRGGGDQPQVVNHFYISAIDAKGVEEITRTKIGPYLTDLYRREILQIPQNAIAGAY